MYIEYSHYSCSPSEPDHYIPRDAMRHCSRRASLARERVLHGTEAVAAQSPLSIASLGCDSIVFSPDSEMIRTPLYSPPFARHAASRPSDCADAIAFIAPNSPSRRLGTCDRMVDCAVRACVRARMCTCLA